MEEITKELERLLLTIMRQRTSLLDWEVHQSTVGISTAPETAPSLPRVHYRNYSFGEKFRIGNFRNVLHYPKFIMQRKFPDIRYVAMMSTLRMICYIKHLPFT